MFWWLIHKLINSAPFFSVSLFFFTLSNCSTTLRLKHRVSKVQFTQAVILVAVCLWWFAYFDLYFTSWSSPLELGPAAEDAIREATKCKHGDVYMGSFRRPVVRERIIRAVFQCLEVWQGPTSPHLSACRCNKSRRVQGISGSQKTEATAGEAGGGRWDELKI